MPSKPPARRRDRPAAGAPKVYCRHDGLRDAAELELHPKNWNLHPPRQLKLYAKIIRGNGWRRAVVVSKRSGFVTKGNGAVLAARAHGLGPVPFEVQPYASEAEELADLTADNKLAEAAEADEAKLEALLQELSAAGTDLELAGIEEVIADAAKAGAKADLSEHFQVIVECADEAAQKKVFARLEKEGLKCQLLTF